MKLFLTACCFLFFAYTAAYPEQGQWKFTFDKDNLIHGIGRSMYANTGISVVSVAKVGSKEKDEEVKVKVGWMLRFTPCAEEYTAMDETVSGKDLDQLKERLYKYYMEPETLQVTQLVYAKTTLKRFEFTQVIEKDLKLHFQDRTKAPIEKIEMANYNATQTEDTESEDKKTASEDDKNTEKKTPDKTANKKTDRKKRAADDKKTTKPTVLNKSVTTEIPPAKQKMAVTTKKPKVKNNSTQDFVKVWEDGMYLFILQIVPEEEYSKADYRIDVTVRMTSKRGKISPLDWPLLVFYGVMGLVYVIYGVVWIVLLACNWRDLLRLQFWIGGVIVLGMLEKAVFFAEYENIAKTGVSVKGAMIFAELVSAVKRALSRMLVIIVSLGFGIIKPRLGQALTKVLAVGGLYFVLAAIEGCMRAKRPKYDQSKDLLFMELPLSVTDAAICWWIFTSLVQTIRTLRLRRNIVKLSLYRHFTNTLIFAILASIAFMIWSITQHKFKSCITDWKELWVDDAFWHLLFCVILAVIMVLWRPTINNQRYAFSPLLDAADDEEEEDIIMNDAFAGMKQRGSKVQANGSPKQPDRNNPDDDLKWVEENIPTSIVDKAMPSLLDSDEEIMTTKFEMSKMD